jgi:hypothetical protein
MISGMWRFGGHLGSAVSALVDGQLDAPSTERAWQHVLSCPQCRRLVEREGWVKRQLAEMAGVDPAAPAGLVGSLHGMDQGVREAWDAVEQLEIRSRGRRRAGIAAVGVGSVSAAVLGLSTLGGAPLGIGGAPSGPPATSLTRLTPSGASTAAPVTASGSPSARPSRTARSSTSPSPSPSAFRGWVVRETEPDPSAAVPVGSPH